MAKDRDLDEAHKDIVTLQRRLDIANKELADTRRDAAVKKTHFRDVIERNTQLEIDLRNAGENQRQDLNHQLAEARAEGEQLKKHRDAAIIRRNAAEREVESLRRRAAIRERRAETLRGNATERQSELEEVMSDIQRREVENEEIRDNMRLRERMTETFKKHGLTAFSVLSALGVVIGVIVSNLKNGLATLGRGLDNGLKAVGKKLGEILPGMVGAIASFLFKTAGEVIGFLGKHAWLLIVAVVMFAVEQFKKKRS